MSKKVIEASQLEQIFLENAMEEGILKKKQHPSVLHIREKAQDVYRAIYEAITEVYLYSDAVLSFSFRWTIFAGMDAVYAWDQDGEERTAQQIVAECISFKGIDDLDYGVMNHIGLKEDSAEFEALERQMTNMINHAGRLLDDVIDDDEAMGAQTFEIAKAVFYFGMAYEMERLEIVEK